MISIILLGLLTSGLWIWYYTVRSEGKNSSRLPFVFALLSTIITLLYLAYLFVGPGRYGEESWL